MTPATVDPAQTEYFASNLMLADALARRYGEDRSTAVKKAAKMTIRQCKDQHLLSLVRRLVMAPPDKVIEVVDRQWDGYRYEYNL